MVLPYINMNPPRVYTCSHSRTPLPPSPATPSPPGHPSAPAPSILHPELWCWRRFSRVSWTCKEIQPGHSKDQSWVFIGRTDAKAETPIFWPPHVKSLLIGKDRDAMRDLGQEEKGTTEDEMAG